LSTLKIGKKYSKAYEYALTFIRMLSIRIMIWCIFQVLILDTLSMDLMHMLSMRLRNSCMHWAYYASGTHVCIKHMHQEQICTLSICIRNSCVQWAYASGTYACTEHTHQKLSMLRIRNLCVNWAYHASGTYACTEHTHQELMRALSTHVRYLCVNWAYYASGTYACTEHTHQELMRALSIHIRYLCMHWAYAQRTLMVAEHTQQFLTSMLSISVTIPNLKMSLLDMLISVLIRI
jgi:hypothetical protein